MIKYLLMLVTLFSLNALAVPECTKSPREAWLKPDQIKEKAKLMGYTVKKVITMEHCSKIEGLDQAGKKVEVFFDPVTGNAVKPTEYHAPVN
jgi:hypothetical protein